MKQTNNFKNVNLYGNSKFINNYYSSSQEERPTYQVKPIWRSEITLASLNWVSLIITILSIFPIYKFLEPALILFGNSDKRIIETSNNNNYIWVLVFLAIILVITLLLRWIAKTQTRRPICKNFAINGLGERLTLEKIIPPTCPQCGGKMKYYQKPIEWQDRYYSNGTYKRIVTKYTPAIECERNSEHWYKVDPAEDKI
ncbi:TPA: hypothetical protein ACK3JH_000633 [Mannheimia haemolytica]